MKYAGTVAAATSAAALSKKAIETITMIRCHGRPTACLATIPLLASPTQNPRHREPNDTGESVPSKVLEQLAKDVILRAPLGRQN